MKNKLLLSLFVVFSAAEILSSCKPRETDQAEVKDSLATMEKVSSALTARTQFAELKDRRIAYRRIGHGQPMLLCNRFRGILDSWDLCLSTALQTILK